MKNKLFRKLKSSNSNKIRKKKQINVIIFIYSRKIRNQKKNYIYKTKINKEERVKEKYNLKNNNYKKYKSKNEKKIIDKNKKN